jgi:putative oxidoreductase
MSEPDGKTSSKGIHVALWVVQVLAAVAFGMSGMMVLGTPIDELVEKGLLFADRMPEGVVRFIGASKALGAVGLILPAATRIAPVLTPIAAALLLLVMVLAAGHHVIYDEISAIMPNLILGSLAAFVAWGRFKISPISKK